MAIGISLLFSLAASAFSGAPAHHDKTLAPYFFVDDADPGVEALPLESTKAEVQISGVIADVVVRQTYKNDGDRTISARYVFPASTRAAVYGMTMTIGDRIIRAKIKEREEARQEYEQAKAAGKTASLLEQDRPNVFAMNVSNILPGDRIEVELRYTELLVPTDGVYELVYPTVVGPRYASEIDQRDAANDFIASPHQRAGQDPTYVFDIRVQLAAGMAIQALESPSHAIQKSFGADRTTASVSLHQGALTGNRDFVLRYVLAGSDIAQGLLLFPGAKESFFLLMVQPPRRPELEQIPPREYVFIIDVSGSMNGFPLDTTKALMRELLGKLRPTDRFNVLLFSGGSSLFAEESVDTGPTSIAEAIAFIDRQQGGGGTELLPALQTAMKLPRGGKSVSRSFVVVTDGFIAGEAAMFDHVRRHLGDANVFAFGIGSSINRFLIEGIAKAGQGEPFFVLDEQHAKDTVDRFRAYVESPVLTRVSVEFDGLETYDVQPAALPDVFANRPVVVFGKYRGTPAGKVTLTGVSGRGRFASAIDAGSVAPDSRHSALPFLWARAKISELSDFQQGDTNREEIVELGLTYSLLTRFTSFIAVHEVVRAKEASTDVAQPLPMPAGVSDSAVGIASGAEPGFTWVLALVGLGLLVWLRRTRSVA